MLDTIGEIFWYAMFFTPVITIPVVWRKSKFSPVTKVLIGLLLALFLSLICLVFAFTIALRDGMGP